MRSEYSAAAEYLDAAEYSAAAEYLDAAEYSAALLNIRQLPNIRQRYRIFGSYRIIVSTEYLNIIGSSVACRTNTMIVFVEFNRILRIR